MLTMMIIYIIQIKDLITNRKQICNKKKINMTEDKNQHFRLLEMILVNQRGLAKQIFQLNENKLNVNPLKDNDKHLLEIAQRLNSNKGNLWIEKFSSTDFSEKIKNISKMIDYMARENSKTRRTRRSQVRSVAK